jgi:two-component system, OmpR family, osmolarity sensor histidine kinase EnvZ
MRGLERLLPASLFGRVLVTLTGTFGLFAIATVVATVHLGLVPVAKRSASDLAGIMVLSARTLVQLPPELREDYRARLASDYDLRLAEERPKADTGAYFFPYIERLQAALEARVGHPVAIITSLANGDRWFWAELEAGEHTVWSGFPRRRLATRPLEGLVLISTLALLLTIATAAILARHVTRPLERLSSAAFEVAQGLSPNPLPESGPAELANLARQFNETSRQVRELLANRTLLLAGLSHDLRTPLTRLRLAVEMLPPEVAPDLEARMTKDIEEMDALIAQTVAFGKTLGAGQRQVVDLGDLISDLVAAHPRVVWQRHPMCPYPVDAVSLRRILGNLLENALRYSQDEVEIHLDCRLAKPVIFVLDRGPGIPEAEREAIFRPYYRLEHSRNRQTGGSGLGLAVARQLAIANQIELHLGRRRGGGTIVSVRLPAVQEMEPPPEGPPHAVDDDTRPA